MMGRNRLGQCLVPGSPAGVLRCPNNETRYAVALSPLQALDHSPVGAHGDDLHAITGVASGIEKGLQIGAGAGDEDDDAHALIFAAATRR